MTAPAVKNENKTFTRIESEVTSFDEEIVLESIDANRTHCFCGLQFFSDVEGKIPVTPTAGVSLIHVQTVNTFPVWEAIPINAINSAAPTTLNWSANTQTVRAKPHVAIEGAAYYKLIVTCNGT